jgi:hypothetical protein
MKFKEDTKNEIKRVLKVFQSSAFFEASLIFLFMIFSGDLFFFSENYRTTY